MWWCSRQAAIPCPGQNCSHLSQTLLLQLSQQLNSGLGRFLYAAGVCNSPLWCRPFSRDIQTVSLYSTALQVKMSGSPARLRLFHVCKSSQVAEFNCFSWCLQCKRSYFSLILVLVLFFLSLCFGKFQLEWFSCFGEGDWKLFVNNKNKLNCPPQVPYFRAGSWALEDKGFMGSQWC